MEQQDPREGGRSQGKDSAQSRAAGKRCLSCGKVLPRSRRTRQYCNDVCRVAAWRSRKAENDRATLLQQTELQSVWDAHQIEGELRVMLQDLLLEHGESAARVATDAVVRAMQEEQVKLQSTKPKPVRAKPIPRTGPLPRELVSLVAFTERHHVARSDIAMGIEKHWVAVVQGDWTAEDGTAITWGLDAFGRYDFYEYFHHVSTFTPCNECPHALV